MHIRELYPDVIAEALDYEYKQVLNPDNPVKWAKTIYVKGDGNTPPASPEEIIALYKRKFGVDNETTEIGYDEKKWTEYIKLCRKYRENSSAPSLKDLQNEEIVTKDGFVKSEFIMFGDSYDGDDSLICCRLWKGKQKTGTVLDHDNSEL